MGILDRFKPQPRWKHADPEVRRGAIAELADIAVLQELAERDPDAAVRTAALAKVDDAAVLGRVSASDADGGVREVAADRLLALALDASSADAATAAAQLSDVRRLSLVAKSTTTDDAREAALARLVDERALGGVARHAKVESTAAAAAARLASADELLATALNSEHKDVALAAFDRVAPTGSTAEDVALLQSVEARAQQKAVARRAKAMLQAIRDEEEARRIALEEKQKREAALCVAVEGLARLADPDRIDSELARLASAWKELASEDDAAVRRFDAGAAAAALRRDQRRGEIAAAIAEENRRREQLAGREALCEQVERIQRDRDAAGAGDDAGTDAGVLEKLGALEAEWAGLAPVAGYEQDVARLAARFAAAASGCRRRIEVEASLRDARAALQAIVDEAESLAGREDKEAADRCRELTRAARGPAATLQDASRPVTDLMDRLAAVGSAIDGAIEAREAAAREAAAKAARDRAAKLVQLAVRAERTAQAEALTLREGERLLRDMAAALEDNARGEAAGDGAKALATLRALQEPLERRVKEMRDLDEWRRFGNLQRQEEMIATAEALVGVLKAEEEAGTPSDLAVAAKVLRDLQSQWKMVAEGPRQGGRRAWERFKAATDELRSRCEVHFAQVREQRSASLAARTALVEQAEALADSTDWARTAARLQEMQKAWEEAGPVPGEAGRALAHRFRTACSAFFTRRREDLKTRKVEWAANIARREALCERAAELAESTEWDEAASELKRLQAEWKTIGPVPHAASEALWKRFRGSADTFFARFAGRHAAAAAARLAEHEALVVALENLLALEEAPADLAEQVQALRTTIANAPPVDGAAATALYERWVAALVALLTRWPASFAGTELDPVALRARMERLVAKVESLVGDDEGDETPVGKSATELLAERLRSALEKNALGVRPDESKWRAAARAVEEARDAWQRLVWLPGLDTGGLEPRFEAACARVTRLAKKHLPPSREPAPGFARDDRGRRPDRPKRRDSRG